MVFATNPTRPFWLTRLKPTEIIGFYCPPGLHEVVRTIPFNDLQEFHFMPDKFHFMPDKFHLMPEPTLRLGFGYKVKARLMNERSFSIMRRLN